MIQIGKKNLNWTNLLDDYIIRLENKNKGKISPCKKTHIIRFNYYFYNDIGDRSFFS